LAYGAGRNYVSVKYFTLTPGEENEGAPEGSKNASARPFEGENVAVITLQMENVNFILFGA